MNAITCDDLVFRRGDRTVLNRIGFELAPGRLLGLIGHNGAGKSTLIKLILGLLKPASGRLEVLGGAPGASPLDVGYLPENVSFYDAMTVEEHLRYFAGLKGVARPRIDELVEELGLGVVLRQRLGQCSKGQRQRLGLAQALLTRPRLLMLDEPTVGLDPAASSLMYRELSALRDAGCAVVVCTHELALVEPYLDQVLLLASAAAAARLRTCAPRPRCPRSSRTSAAATRLPTPSSRPTCAARVSPFPRATSPASSGASPRRTASTTSSFARRIWA